MPTPSFAPVLPPEPKLTIPTGSVLSSGSCLWKWVASQAEWVILEDRSASGYGPGFGPGQPGRFDGQIVRWASVPSSSNGNGH
jgi:hypothetical protein